MIKVCSEPGPFPSQLWAETLTEMFVKLKHEVDDTSNTFPQTVSPQKEAGIVEKPHVSPELESE